MLVDRPVHRAGRSSATLRDHVSDQRVQKDIHELSFNRMACRFATTRVDLPSARGELSAVRCIHLAVTPTCGVYFGASFSFAISIPSEYPHAPPRVACIDATHCDEWSRDSASFARRREPSDAARRTFHPNIAQLDGRVALPLLDRDWRPVLSINSVVLALQYLFVEPVMDAAYVLNSDAAQLWCANDPAAMQRRAQELLTGRGPRWRGGNGAAEGGGASSDLDTDQCSDMDDERASGGSGGGDFALSFNRSCAMHAKSAAAQRQQQRRVSSSDGGGGGGRKRPRTFGGDVGAAGGDAAASAHELVMSPSRRFRYSRSGDGAAAAVAAAPEAVGAVAGGRTRMFWGSDAAVAFPARERQAPPSPTSVHQQPASGGGEGGGGAAARAGDARGQQARGASAAWGTAASYPSLQAAEPLQFEQRGRKHQRGAMRSVDAKRLRVRSPGEEGGGGGGGGASFSMER